MQNVKPSSWPLVAILLVGFVLRVGGAVVWQARIGDGRFVFGDSESYWHLAGTLARCEPYQYGTPEAQVFRTPGYPLLLAPLFVIAGGAPPIMAARFLSVLCGTVAIAAVYWLAQMLFDRRTALTAAVAVAIYPGAIVLSVVVLSEAPFVPLMVLHLALWVAAWQATTTLRSATLAGTGGLIAAATTLVRPSWLLFVPFVMLVGLMGSQRGKHVMIAGTMCAGLVLGMLPWWIRNAQVTRHFVPTTLQVGASLYDGWNPAATGGSEMSFVARFAESERQLPASDESFEYRLDRRLWRAAWDWALAHPRRVFELAAVKTLRMWNVWPNESQFAAWPVRLAVLVCYVPLLALGLVGAWRFRQAGFPLALCWLPALYLTLVHAVFVSSLRYREPAMLPLAVLASAVLSRASPRPIQD
jgi:4-amino-4-deoxy-L-arabinose transferase-like glycosyltransferase